jgi:hypothetical protein
MEKAMSRNRRRPTYYHVHCLRDGTIIAAYPVRKPTPHTLKRDNRRIDDDNVCAEYDTSGDQLRDVKNDGRTRFQDIISNALNVRRAVRQLVIPHLNELASQLAAISAHLERLADASESGR